MPAPTPPLPKASYNDSSSRRTTACGSVNPCCQLVVEVSTTASAAPATESIKPPVESIEPPVEEPAKPDAALARLAPRSVACAYATRLNGLFGLRRSVLSLLFDTMLAEMAVSIDAKHDGCTISALQLPRVVEVLSLRRPSSGKVTEGKVLDIKVLPGDELRLRGPAHVLATLATLKNGKLPVLDSKRAREQLSTALKTERQLLIIAAEDLQRRLLPHALRHITKRRLNEKQRRASTKLQALRRGQLARRSTGQVDRVRQTRRKVGVMRAKRLVAALKALQRVSGAGKGRGGDGGYKPAGEEREWKTRAQLAHERTVMQRFAKQSAIARAHTASLNKTLAAAPEASSVGSALAGKLPLTPLTALFAIGLGKGGSDGRRRAGCGGVTGVVELSAVVDKGVPAGGTLGGSIRLPPGVAAVRVVTATATPYASAGLATTAPLPSNTKVQSADLVTLRGAPHLIAGLTECRSGKLWLLTAAPARAARASILRHERFSLLASAERLARRVQRLVRRRFKEAQAVREADAARRVQIAFLEHWSRMHGADRPTGTGLVPPSVPKANRYGPHGSRGKPSMPSMPSASPRVAPRRTPVAPPPVPPLVPAGATTSSSRSASTLTSPSQQHPTGGAASSCGGGSSTRPSELETPIRPCPNSGRRPHPAEPAAAKGPFANGKVACSDLFERQPYVRAAAKAAPPPPPPQPHRSHLEMLRERVNR